METPNERLNGTVSTWVAKKHWGYIARPANDRDVLRYWFHISEFAGEEIHVGLNVSFSVKPIREGKCWTAENIRPL